MSGQPIHVFNHHAMATFYQVRIAGEERAYAAQAAQAAFQVTDRLEGLFSRFRENSEISQITQLAPGEKLRVGEPTFACLEMAKEMEAATHGAFSIAPTAMSKQSTQPNWSLTRESFTVQCEAGKLEFDLGAIGKGFALDRMAVELTEWQCPAYLLVAGGSSVLAGSAPPGTTGWSSGFGDDNADRRLLLTHCSLSGSGIAVKGRHILDPRTGEPAQKRARAWALASTAAESDALSTACMVLDEAEIAEMMAERKDWLVWLHDEKGWRQFGARPSPPVAEKTAD